MKLKHWTLDRVSFFLSDFLQNPYFSKAEEIIVVSIGGFEDLAFACPFMYLKLVQEQLKLITIQ